MGAMALGYFGRRATIKKAQPYGAEPFENW